MVSEEFEKATNGSIDTAGLSWLVDPLDGTKEFLKRTKEFTVNVALIDAGIAILGVVHAPALSLTYYGGRNFGTWRKAGDEPPIPISTRCASASQAVVVASKDHAGPLVSTLLARLTNPQLRSMLGSRGEFAGIQAGRTAMY